MVQIFMQKLDWCKAPWKCKLYGRYFHVNAYLWCQIVVGYYSLRITGAWNLNLSNENMFHSQLCNMFVYIHLWVCMYPWSIFVHVAHFLWHNISCKLINLDITIFVALNYHLSCCQPRCKFQTPNNTLQVHQIL